MSYAVGQRVWARDMGHWVEAVISEVYGYGQFLNPPTYEVWLPDYTNSVLSHNDIHPYFSHGIPPMPKENNDQRG